MATLFPEDLYYGQDGQTTLRLITPYTPEKNQLTVYLNGLVAILERDYEEVDDHTIEFLEPLAAGDVILVQSKLGNESRNTTGGAFFPQDLYFGEDGQTHINLTSPYQTGTNQLIVYLNGLLAIRGHDYEEVDSNTIEFLYQLSSGDTILVESKIAVNMSDITVGSDEGWFQKYGTVNTLLKNQKYTLSLNYDGQQFEHEFYTVMTPLYSNVPVIRNDLGDVVSEIEDLRILYLVYQNSVLAQNIASETSIALLETESKTPYIFRQYVRYRTELDIITAIYMNATGRSGGVSKMLGTLKIDRKYNMASLDLKSTIEDLKMKLREWERALRGTTVTSPMATAVRSGSSSAYPLTSPRRTFASGVTETQ